MKNSQFCIIQAELSIIISYLTTFIWVKVSLVIIAVLFLIIAIMERKEEEK